MGIILRTLRDSCLGVALSTPKPRRAFMGRSPYSGASGRLLSPEPRTSRCGHGVGERHHRLRTSRTRPREMVNNAFRACLACLTGCERRNLWVMVGASHHMADRIAILGLRSRAIRRICTDTTDCATFLCRVYDPVGHIRAIDRQWADRNHGTPHFSVQLGLVGQESHQKSGSAIRSRTGTCSRRLGFEPSVPAYSTIAPQNGGPRGSRTRMPCGAGF